MSQFRIDTQRATKKWSTVLENMGVKSDRIEWMSEMAESGKERSPCRTSLSAVEPTGAGQR
jgi:hypothetical protein